MASQFASAHVSNPLVYPNIWTRTGLEQYKPTASDENKVDDIQNVYFEHEDGQSNSEYDPTWHVTIESNENQLDYSDDNDENMEPTCNDSDLGLGYALSDDHNEAYPIDELVEARYFQEFYEPPEISPQRIDAKR